MTRIFKDWLSRRKWQDVIFAAGEIVFMLSLLPSVFSEQKPAPLTSIATALMLCLFLFVHASYKLWMAFTLCTATIALWFVLFLQAV
jgi:hypothetical protein